VVALSTSYWLIAGVILLMVLFLTRIFVLMHDCGHGSMFRSGRVNRGFGFVLGVLAGIAAVRVVPAPRIPPRDQRQLGEVPRPRSSSTRSTSTRR
jgi:hypothetical protein